MLCKFQVCTTFPLGGDRFWKWAQNEGKLCNAHRCPKMADFLLCLDHGCQLHFCTSWRVKNACQISYLSVTRAGRSSCLNFSRWRYGAILANKTCNAVKYEMFPDSCSAYEIWARWDHVQPRYEEFHFHGETWKFTAPPQTRPLTTSHHFLSDSISMC